MTELNWTENYKEELNRTEEYKNWKKKNILQGINSRSDNTEDQISELEYRVVKISQAELKKGKRISKNEDSLRDLWDSIKYTNICVIRVPEEGKK